MQKYYIKYDGCEVGPMEIGHLPFFGLSEDSLVRKEGEDSLAPARCYPELMDSIAAKSESEGMTKYGDEPEGSADGGTQSCKNTGMETFGGVCAYPPAICKISLAVCVIALAVFAYSVYSMEHYKVLDEIWFGDIGYRYADLLGIIAFDYYLPCTDAFYEYYWLVTVCACVSAAAAAVSAVVCFFTRRR